MNSNSLTNFFDLLKTVHLSSRYRPSFYCPEKISDDLVIEFITPKKNVFISLKTNLNLEGLPLNIIFCHHDLW